MNDYLMSLEVGYWVEPSWLQTVLQEVEKEGGIEMFLSNRGITEDIQSAVRENVLQERTGVNDWSLYTWGE